MSDPPNDPRGARLVVHAWAREDAPLPPWLGAGLEARGARVLCAADWPALRKLAAAAPPDAVLVRGLPDEPAACCRRLRRLTGRAGLPVVFLVEERAEPGTEGRLLASGAADAVRLPADSELLAAKLEAAVADAERWSAPSRWPRGTIRAPDGLVVLEPRARRCLLRGEDGAYRAVLLTGRQFDTLAALLRRAGRPVSWRELYRRGWRPGKLRAKSRTLVQHVLSLRRKLGVAGARIGAIPGYGYSYRTGFET